MRKNKIVLLLSSLLLSNSVLADITGYSGFLFDPVNNGNLKNGSIDAYDSSYYLAVNGTPFLDVVGVLSQDQRTINYPITSIGNGLTVSRSFYVPNKDSNKNADYGRYLDCVKNASASTIQNIDINITGNLGSDNNTAIYASSDGDNTLSSSDTWFSTDDIDGSDDPSLAHVMGKGVVNPTLNGDVISWHFTIPSLAKSQTACVVTYAIQASTQKDTQTLASKLANSPDLSGINTVVKSKILNFADSAQITIFPASSKLAENSNFDANIILVGSDSALNGGVLSILLNDTDVSTSCSIQKSIMKADNSASWGRVVQCPNISTLLNKTGSNTLKVTHTTTSGWKAVGSAQWDIYPLAVLPTP